jgi:hypothetical protein
MIEHFSKRVELVALPNRLSHNTSQGFLQQVLSRFGACVECLTNQGSEFRGEFQDLLDHAFIDLYQTSKDHPQADGLAERMVQTCKKGFQKICLNKNKKDWDLALSSIVAQMDQVVDLDSPATWAKVITEKTEYTCSN